jgi:hypothetical protein
LTTLVSGLDAVALWITRALNPAVIAVAAFALLAGYPASTSLVSIGWAVLWGPTLPTLYAVVVYWSGGSDTVFIAGGKHRILPLILAAATNAVGVWHMVQLEAPHHLALLLAGYAILSLVATGLSVRWRISLHMSGVAVPWMVGLAINGSGMLWLFPVATIVGWARVRRDDHTLAQVIAGGVIGLGSAWCALALLDLPG